MLKKFALVLTVIFVLVPMIGIHAQSDNYDDFPVFDTTEEPTLAQAEELAEWADAKDLPVDALLGAIDHHFDNGWSEFGEQPFSSFDTVDFEVATLIWVDFKSTNLPDCFNWLQNQGHWGVGVAEAECEFDVPSFVQGGRLLYLAADEDADEESCPALDEIVESVGDLDVLETIEVLSENYAWHSYEADTTYTIPDGDYLIVQTDWGTDEYPEVFETITSTATEGGWGTFVVLGPVQVDLSSEGAYHTNFCE